MKIWNLKIGIYLGFVILVFGFAALAATGCATVVDQTMEINDTSVVGTSEVTLSGALSYSGGRVDINLGAVIISGEAQTITAGKVRVRVGSSLSTITSAGTLEFTLPTVTSTAIDMAFILDNTGSMDGEITGSIASINDFAASLEAEGADVKFGLVTYGDSAVHPTPVGTITSESFTDAFTQSRPIMDFGTATALKTILSEEVVADGGADSPENPLDAILYAFNNFTWRAAAQRVFILITDAAAHQLGVAGTNNHCTTTGSAVVSTLEGRAVVYAVSPLPASIISGYLDVRRLADGLEYGSVTPESNTGGKWIELPSSGDFDLNDLGISTTVTTSYTIRFTYSFEAGTYYILVEVDTDGDGVFDSNMVIEVIVVGSSSISSPAVSIPVSSDVADGIPTLYITKPQPAVYFDRPGNQN